MSCYRSQQPDTRSWPSTLPCTP